MKHLFWLLFVSFQLCQAQKLKKADKIILANMQTHIAYLASDKLEGRRTGTTGEKLAYEYISAEFSKTGLLPMGDSGTYLQAFEVNDGRFISPSSHVIINGNDLALEKDFFPLSFCPNASLEATAAVALHESGNPWFFDLKDIMETNKDNPHFDLKDAIKSQVADAAKKGASALFLFNTSEVKDDLKFDGKNKEPLLNIPIIYFCKPAADKFLKDETATLDIKLKIHIAEKKRTGHNVIAYKNNNAANTIIMGAHYDHLGYGEDNNSLYSGTDIQIHNGADDNASGTAAIIELSKTLSASKFKNNNYLFISFSGEELGLYGSKFFTEHPSIDLTKANYMVNLDMIGRLNDSTHGLSIGGYGTSPAWASLINADNKFFTIKIDSSGTGPSDHTSFYRKDIPVLFFFTGLHSDYHKPTDDADKINFNGALQVVKFINKLVEATDTKSKLSFTKTREVAMSNKTNFKVTMGIMPDYTFSGAGVRADGISEGKLAQRVGIKAGDVLVQLGEHTFSNMQSYMETLAKFKKGDATKVKVIRGKEELVFDVVF